MADYEEIAAEIACEFDIRDRKKLCRWIQQADEVANGDQYPLADIAKAAEKLDGCCHGNWLASAAGGE